MKTALLILASFAAAALAAAHSVAPVGAAIILPLGGL